MHVARGRARELPGNCNLATSQAPSFAALQATATPAMAYTRKSRSQPGQVQRALAGALALRSPCCVYSFTHVIAPSGCE